MSVRVRPVVSSLDTTHGITGNSDTELASYMLSLRSPPHGKISNNNSNNNTATLPAFNNKPLTISNVLQSIENIQPKSSSSSPVNSKEQVSQAEINQYLQPASMLLQSQPQPMQQQPLMYNMIPQSLPYSSNPYEIYHQIPMQYTAMPQHTNYVQYNQPHMPMSYSQPLPYMSSPLQMPPTYTLAPPHSQPNGLPDLHSTLQQYTHTNATAAHQRKRNASAMSDSPSKLAHPSRYLMKKYTPSDYEELKTTNQQSVGRAAQGLRLCSARVCAKLQQLQTSTYNDIADMLVNELSEHTDNAESKLMEEKNIRRRIYDTLNVLLAMQIIQRTKKDIKWMGLQAADQYVNSFASNNTHSVPRNINHNKLKHSHHTSHHIDTTANGTDNVTMKQRELFDLVLIYLNNYNLCERNKHRSAHHSDTYQLQLPFRLVVINGAFECYANDNNTHVQLQATSKFDFAEDTAVVNHHFIQLLRSTQVKKPDLRAAVWQHLQQILPKEIYDYLLQHKHTEALLFKQIEQLAEHNNKLDQRNNRLFHTPSTKHSTMAKTPNRFSPEILHFNSAKSTASHTKRIDTTLASVGLSLFSPNHKHDSNQDTNS